MKAPRLIRLFGGLLVVFLLLAVGFSQAQAIHDWYKLRGYTPPHAVVQLADDIALTPTSRHVFYVNHPAIDDRAAFNSVCSSKDEQSIVLGCYHPVDDGIFVFDVTDDRLKGVDQVTAAHELLHAEYDRLSPSDKQTVDTELEDFYQHQLKDDRIKQTIAIYQKTEPNDVVNEMHSIFGTEVADLPSPLENYYSRYFQSRAKVVSYAASYQQEFTSRQNKVAADDAQLTKLKQQIDTDTATIKQMAAALQTQQQNLNALRGQTSAAAYNNQVASYNAQVDAYNGLVQQTRGLISQYNAVVDERNQVALQVNSLAKAINSSISSIPQ